MTRFLRLITDDRGATAIEYALIATLIGIAVIGSVTSLGGEVDNTWGFISNSLSNAVNS
ncbi:MAG TPA: Flp family type IVb pilin [Allosphingosinicella sp.]|uniref:Flp family type IVb pilin n=1 Tax=Allosphingosinicella sp. TaxID=2823234 RepID=UPI002EDA1A8B